ncbi:hypothetical protein AVEN_47437-1, partial [Araneus ventricosus]
MVRSLRNVPNEDPDPQKERLDSSPIKRNESAERTRTPFTDPDSPFGFGLLVRDDEYLTNCYFLRNIKNSQISVMNTTVKK